MCFLECSASLGSPCFRFAIAKVGRFGILAKRCDLFFSKTCNFVSGTLYIYCARDGKWGKAGFEISGNAMGHVRRGIGEDVMRALGRVRRGDERGWTAEWGKRWGEVLHLGQCGAVADAARCDG